MFRKATLQDLDAIAAIYNAIHSHEEAGLSVIGWNRAIYPTRASGEKAILDGEMYVLEEDGRILAAAKINQKQEDSYAEGTWTHEAEDSKVMVLHTLVVDPADTRYGRRNRCRRKSFRKRRPVRTSRKKRCALFWRRSCLPRRTRRGLTCRKFRSATKRISSLRNIYWNENGKAKEYARANCLKY